MTTPVLAIDHLSKGFSRWGVFHKALDDITLHVPPGQWLVVAGHNGSGKSTLLNLVSGRVPIEEGTIHVRGESIATLPATAIPTHVFLVHQDPMLGTAPLLTVFENLYVADRQTKGVRRRTLAKRYESMLEPLGLGGKLKQLVQSLSGGQRKLLSILIARLQPAPLILLDEPLAALDPEKTELALNEMRDLHAANKTLLQVSHEVEHLADLGDRTVVLKDGRIVYDEVAADRSLEDIRGTWFA